VKTPDAVAYVVRSYPRLSQTFVLEEIRSLERLGLDIRVFALSNPHESLRQSEVGDVRASVRYLDRAGSLRGLAAHAAEFLRRPHRYVGTLAEAFRAGAADRGYRVDSRFRCFHHAVLLAGFLRRERAADGRGIRRLHAHFAHDPTLVTLWAHRLTGIPFGFTAHARDLYQINPRELVSRVRAASAVVTCCRANVEYLETMLPRELHERVTLVHHGVDLRAIEARNGGPRREGPLRVLTVGRLVEKKGIDDLLLACRALERSGRCFHLDIYGDGPERQRLEAIARGLGLERQVTLHGARPRGEILAACREADVFVLTPYVTADGDRDGIPNVIIEAMASGVPVVTTAAGGIPELVQAEHNGIGVPPRDVDAIARALGRLLDDRDLRLRLGAAGRRSVEKEFDQRHTAGQMARVLGAATPESSTFGASAIAPEAAVRRPHHGARAAFRLLRHFAEGHYPFFALALIMLVLEASSGVFQPWPIGYVVDFLNGKKPALAAIGQLSPRIGTIVFLTGAIILTAALRSLFDSLAEIFLARAGRRLGYRLRVTLYTHLQKLSLAFHSRRQTGEMLRRVTSDVEQIENFIIASLSDITGAILVLLGTIIFLTIRSWPVAVLAAILVPMLSAIAHFFSERITATSRRQRAREADLMSAAQEMLTSIPVVQTFGQSEYEEHRFAEGSRNAMVAALDSVGLQASFSWVVGVVEALSTSAVIWLGIWLVDRRSLTVGTLIFFIILIQNMFKPARKIIKQWSLVGRMRASAERVADVLERRPSVRDLPGARTAPALAGRIEFRDIHFTYEPDPEDAADNPARTRVLEHVSFEIPPGEVVALIGPSGAGKSTIAQLLPRLYDPQSGSVRIDGQDVREFTLDSLRRQISMVLQDTILFRGSVAHNIGYGRVGATRDEIVAAAKRANAHEFIERMPEGYDTQLSERASNLSGGQRQRLAIARAFVRRAPILILDEPTTGLDAASAEQVIAGLRELMKGKTTLIISHDPGLIQRADRILVIRNGTVEERQPQPSANGGGPAHDPLHDAVHDAQGAALSHPAKRVE